MELTVIGYMVLLRDTNGHFLTYIPVHTNIIPTRNGGNDRRSDKQQVERET